MNIYPESKIAHLGAIKSSLRCILIPLPSVKFKSSAWLNPKSNREWPPQAYSTFRISDRKPARLSWLAVRPSIGCWKCESRVSLEGPNCLEWLPKRASARFTKQTFAVANQARIMPRRYIHRQIAHGASRRAICAKCTHAMAGVSLFYMQGIHRSHPAAGLLCTNWLCLCLCATCQYFARVMPGSADGVALIGFGARKVGIFDPWRDSCKAKTPWWHSAKRCVSEWWDNLSSSLSLRCVSKLYIRGKRSS